MKREAPIISVYNAGDRARWFRIALLEILRELGGGGHKLGEALQYGLVGHTAMCGFEVEAFQVGGGGIVDEAAASSGGGARGLQSSPALASGGSPCQHGPDRGPTVRLCTFW